MSKGIKISEKHGVNPSLVTCFYCGEETGEIALLGKLPKDAEAPKHICTSVAPCEKCAEKYKDYVLMVEADLDSKGKPNPTGRWFAIKKEAIIEEYRNTPVAYMRSDEFQEMLDNIKL